MYACVHNIGPVHAQGLARCTLRHLPRVARHGRRAPWCARRPRQSKSTWRPRRPLRSRRCPRSRPARCPWNQSCRHQAAFWAVSAQRVFSMPNVHSPRSIPHTHPLAACGGQLRALAIRSRTWLSETRPKSVDGSVQPALLMGPSRTSRSQAGPVKRHGRSNSPRWGPAPGSRYRASAMDVEKTAPKCGGSVQPALVDMAEPGFKIPCGTSPPARPHRTLTFGSAVSNGSSCTDAHANQSCEAISGTRLPGRSSRLRGRFPVCGPWLLALGGRRLAVCGERTGGRRWAAGCGRWAACGG